MPRRKHPRRPPSFERVEGRMPVPSASGRRAYPTVHEALATPAGASILRAAAHAAALISVVALGAGCARTECAPTALGEAKVHSLDAIESLVDLSPIDASRQLGIGLGIVPHPATRFIGGEAPMVTPAVPVPTPPAPTAVEPKPEPSDA